MQDDIVSAVLAREEVARYLRGEGGEPPAVVRARIERYLDELKTTQRYPIYRALRHPLQPVFRRITPVAEGLEAVDAALAAGRVVYVSNHKSHLDYLVEPLVLDDHGVRAPVIAAGINLFAGPLALLHRHVTGAIPIRRNARDPAYLATLKAYVAELLRRHDLLFYIEGGRSYTGELKPPKTGLLHAALLADTRVLFVPVAVAYDLVLEDRILARQAERRRPLAFSRELAEMIRYGIGYRSRAFVCFGTPVSAEAHDPTSRRDVLQLARTIRDAIGRLYKVLPTALVAAAMRPSISRGELEDRVGALLASLAERGANLAVASAREAVDTGTSQLVERDVLVAERGRFRVRRRLVLRYYARTIEHLIAA
ncbi:MAG TPA: 1-acyl-sn-glycerol-3-phosphate acyltransferase [Vicinamibacterales bacterium]|jgi:glycerol-3-phosphate O-acyltransferase|nr:1-acyl-sn-glycerol-3-phosphate acyltransferase [Vicinamibacterales bacterium]